MKILIVCGAGRTFGREIVTLTLAQGLKKRGHEVRCVTTTWSDGSFQTKLDELMIPWDAIPLGFISKQISFNTLTMTAAQLLKLPTLWLQYRNIIESFRPDVVMHSAFHHVVVLWPLLNRFTNVYHAHDYVSPTIFHAHLFKRLSKRIAKFVAVSDFVATGLKGLGVPPAKIAAVKNGVPSEVLNSKSLSNHGATVSHGRLRIGVVGQIEEWKGHLDVVEALRALKHCGQAFVCRLYGGGSQDFRSLLEQRIREANLSENFEWMGYVSNPALIYPYLDVCVVASRFPEALGMVAVEAMHFGIPVIATREGGLPEVVKDGVTGFLVDSQSPRQITACLEKLVQSDLRRAEMGRAAKLYALREFTEENMCEAFEKIIEVRRTV